MNSAGSKPIDAATRYCAVYGSPIRHSASPALQNAGFDALGLNWRYLAFEVHPDALAAALAGARSMHFIGINLTVPHKLLAVPLVDELDASAAQWGAVNTVCFEGRAADGAWLPLAQFSTTLPREVRSRGFNTDAGALVRALAEDLGFDAAGRSILLLGAGGAGRVAALCLAAAGASDLFLVNRTVERAESLLVDITQKNLATRVTVGYPRGRVDLVVNATTLGLHPSDPLPYDAGRFNLRDAGAVYDMVYRPTPTPLLSAAGQAGCKAASGLGMLLHQGADAFEIWTGRPAPRAIMRAALEAHLGQVARATHEAVGANPMPGPGAETRRNC